MNRQEFIDDIVDMYGLKQFDYDYDIEMLGDVYDRDGFNDYVWSAVSDWCDGWESLGSWLYNLPSPDDYDYFDMSDEPCGVGQWEFDYWKGKILEYCDDNNLWDDDEGGYACDDVPDYVPPVQEDDGQLLMLLSVC